MDHANLEALKRLHPGWRLLAAAHAPMVASFLHATFIQPIVRTMAQQALVARLDDFLYEVRQREGAEAYPRSAVQYLEPPVLGFGDAAIGPEKMIRQGPSGTRAVPAGRP